MEFSANLGDGGMLSVELTVSAHGVLVCLGTVGSLFLLFFVSLESSHLLLLVFTSVMGNRRSGSLVLNNGLGSGSCSFNGMYWVCCTG